MNPTPEQQTAATAGTQPDDLVAQVRHQLQQLDPTETEYATRFVEILLTGAWQLRASDIHLQPMRKGLSVDWRIDGVLHPVGRFPRGKAADPVTRLKVLADLLTYKSNIPQEGRVREAMFPDNMFPDNMFPDNMIPGEMRVSVFPTLYGERVAVRIFAMNEKLIHLGQLGFTADLIGPLRQLLRETSGMVLITGPAGSGKTTTAYACLREIAEQGYGQRCIMTLEDPVEVAVTGVSQSQVNDAVGFTFAAGLRSLLRQDPEVILVGEIRDRETAEIAFQAALTGQLVVSTFHAGSSAEAISRLADMGIEPYLLRSGILGILGQRLVRRLCSCAQRDDAAAERLQLSIDKAWRSEGCSDCAGTGYQGRMPLAELFMPTTDELGQAILSKAAAPQLESLAVRDGMQTRWTRALEAMEAGLTTPDEVRRILGFGDLAAS